MTEKQYIIERAKVLEQDPKKTIKQLMGNLTVREFYNQTLNSFNILVDKLNETPSLEEKLLPQIHNKMIILGALVKFIRTHFKREMTETEILEGFKL